MQHACRIVAALAVAAGSLLLPGAPPVGAAPSVYPTWTLAGTAEPSGTMTIPATGFPTATFMSNSNTITNPGGAAAFLNATTPFGAFFGSSQGRPYLNVPAAPGALPSTVTYTFATPTPATGWGFNLGDIDADTVQIAATGPTHRPLRNARQLPERSARPSDKTSQQKA